MRSSLFLSCLVCISYVVSFNLNKNRCDTRLYSNSDAIIPPCTSCKWFLPNNRKYTGLCGFYKTTYYLLGVKMTIHEFAEHCRNNESLCGKEGYMYEPVRQQPPS